MTHSQTFSDPLETTYQRAILEGTAPNTRRAYTRDLNYFWCWGLHALGLEEHLPVKVETVLRFVLDHALEMDPVLLNTLIKQKARTRRGPLRIKTIRRYLASLSVAHQEQGFESPIHNPQVRLLLSRLQRTQAHLPSNRKEAITADLLKRLTDTCDESLHGIRDRAILLVGFASGGRRRSEIANLQAEDLRKIESGYIIHIRHSKSDQHGIGHDAPLLGEAASALSRWILRSGIRQGPLFRGILPGGKFNEAIGNQTINRIVKRRARLAGIDSSKFGAHSLRSGFITESARKGAAIGDAMVLSGHRDHRAAQRYYREGVLMSNPAAHLLE